jgi:hypothetical protein
MSIYSYQYVMTEQEVEAVNKAAAIFPDTPREIIERQAREIVYRRDFKNKK